ncbi:MAG: hypothetical protein HY067_22330 [Betaproteobacteria bacterium]|nr:hypothetical protein [Betaproteobacteria bacterium]
MFAFVGSANTFFRDDLGGAIKHAASGGALKGTKEDMIKGYVAECEQRLATANRYHVLLAEVQAITNELEKGRFTLSTIQKFKERSAVKQSVNRLKEAFADKLEKYEA